MNSVTSFEKLAMLAVKREINNNLNLLDSYDYGYKFFSTSYKEKGDYGQTVTVWLEFEVHYPHYWDLIPIVVVYKGHCLYLEDVCQRTGQYFRDSVKRLEKRLVKSQSKVKLEEV